MVASGEKKVKLRWITHNWHLKLLALGIAVAMWGYVVGQEKAEMTLVMPLELTGIPEQLVVANSPPAEIRLRVYGRRSLLRRLAELKPVKTLSLEGAGPGEHLFELLPEEMDMPYGIKVVGISPSKVRVVLARKARRKVPVRPVIKGKPAPGYEVVDVTFSPPKVTISGLKSEVAEVDWVWTTPMDVTGLTDTVLFTPRLRVPAFGRIRISPEYVEAVVKIRPISRRREAGK